MPAGLIWRPSVHRKKAGLLVAAFRRLHELLEKKDYQVDYASDSSATDGSFDFGSWLSGRVKEYRPERPGTIDLTDQPITPEEATVQLEHFIHHLLPSFGRYQDAMWDSEPSLFHSRLSFALNTRLLHPRAVVSAAQRAYHEDGAPLPAVEGFIRQVLGWREYVRGVYWMQLQLKNLRRKDSSEVRMIQKQAEALRSTS